MILFFAWKRMMRDWKSSEPQDHHWNLATERFLYETEAPEAHQVQLLWWQDKFQLGESALKTEERCGWGRPTSPKGTTSFARRAPSSPPGWLIVKSQIGRLINIDQSSPSAGTNVPSYTLLFTLLFTHLFTLLFTLLFTERANLKTSQPCPPENWRYRIYRARPSTEQWTIHHIRHTKTVFPTRYFYTDKEAVDVPKTEKLFIDNELLLTFMEKTETRLGGLPLWFGIIGWFSN